MVNIQTGDVLLCAYNDTLFSKLIAWRNRFYNKSPYSHAAIIISEEDELGMVKVAEALGKGFVISDYELWWLENQFKIGRIGLYRPNQPLKNIYENAKKYEGTGYGWLAIFYIGLSLIDKDAPLISDGAKHLICSEAVARILYDSSKSIDFEKEFGKPFDFITPDDLSKSKFLEEQ